MMRAMMLVFAMVFLVLATIQAQAGNWAIATFDMVMVCFNILHARTIVISEKLDKLIGEKK